MSVKTLRDQLIEIFPREVVPEEEVVRLAHELNELVPNAMARELRQRIQVYRVLHDHGERVRQKAHLAAVAVELVSSRGDFLADDSTLREGLLDGTSRPEYDRAVKRFKEQNRARQREERRLRAERERWQRWLDAIQDACASMSTIATQIERPLVALADEDLRLCLTWGNRGPIFSEPINDQWRHFVREDPNEALRLWSARSAELAAISFLTESGKQTTDVSILQLGAGSDEWRTHDIDADGEPIDVKNARRSWSSPNSYVGHVIPIFKYARRRTTQVTILGVLSDYVAWPRIDQGSFGSAIILGELRKVDIAALASWMHRQFGDILDFGLIVREPLNTYPGWLFEYPMPWYSARAGALDQIRGLLRECPDENKATNVVPLYVRLLLDEAERVLERGAKLDQELFCQLKSLHEEIGLSRRSIFGWILGLMLRKLIGPGESSIRDTAASLRRLLLVQSSRGTNRHVGGLFDPLDYIVNLLSMFEEIEKNIAPRLLQSLRSFKLTAPTTLRGQVENGRTQTVFAHCGGWVRHPFEAKCGMNPIHLGNSEICPQCDFLICMRCAYCSDSCSLVKSRMDTHAANEAKGLTLLGKL